jgi:cytochrome oxidase Cu insertion factor (SCO1/SenC/PrrC family)
MGRRAYEPFRVPSLPARGTTDNLKKENKMPRVSLNQPAPDFSLPDFAGNRVSLSDFRGRKNVLLAFNRTFA